MLPGNLPGWHQNGILMAISGNVFTRVGLLVDLYSVIEPAIPYKVNYKITPHSCMEVIQTVYGMSFSIMC